MAAFALLAVTGLAVRPLVRLTARRGLVRHASASADGGGEQPELRTRSTGLVEDQDALFGGSAERRERLHDALVQSHGADSLDFVEDPAFVGSSALRCYDAFIHPRSQGGLLAADKSTRARVIANQIVFHVRELRAYRAEWLRNTDAVIAASAPPAHPLTLVLDNMRSAENTGTIFRLAECAGLTEIITCGITPSPPHPALLKTAMGTDQRVRTRHIPSTLDAVAQLQAEGMRVCAAETAGGSASLFKLGAENPAKMGGSQLLSPPLAIILGNELVGVDARVLAKVDGVVHLPTFGQKNSLNVATCASVLVYEILRQWGKLDE
mmetsp:Transcript_6821/g.16589  ORF Transcript_6821/g.16589 Transcript_6821/m.16589 type:complete len:323 (-) Transcript_6821:124-1092(-)